MKTMKIIFLIAVFGTLLMSNSGFAQDDKSYLVTVTKLHWNQENKNFSNDEWIATEKEFLDKVTKKNPFIVSSEVLMHSFTDDNTELLLVTMYEKWEDIEKRKKGRRRIEKEKEKENKNEIRMIMITRKKKKEIK